jgi:indole-3-glycerol phosphate synthase
LETERVDVLSRIIDKKRERVESAKLMAPVESVRSVALEKRRRSRSHALVDALKRDEINIIAEFKRKSPSKGVICAAANPTSFANCYKVGGAVGISVLTEEDYFEGSLNDLRTVKSEVDLPVLRKDFVFDDYQIYEAAAAGADAVLLIVAALDDQLLVRLRRVAEEELGIDALIEVHTKTEMERAAACGATLIGVNNRDLRTFEVSLNTSFQLADEVPSEAVLVSESGFHSKEDLQKLRNVGYRGFLIGELLMRADRPEDVLRELRD